MSTGGGEAVADTRVGERRVAEWDDHVETLLGTALEVWRANRDPGTLLELLGPIIAAVGHRGAL